MPASEKCADSARWRIEIVKDPHTREPDKAKAAAIAKTANENGLLLTTGINGNIIRFLTPLVVTDEQLKEAFPLSKQLCEFNYWNAAGCVCYHESVRYINKHSMALL